jgi:hypothetical protein
LHRFAHRGRNLTRKKGASIGQAIDHQIQQCPQARETAQIAVIAGVDAAAWRVFANLQADDAGRRVPQRINASGGIAFALTRSTAGSTMPGHVVPLVDPRHFTLETVGDAYRAIKERTARGKLVDIAAT